jgi:hypothetical protein
VLIVLGKITTSTMLGLSLVGHLSLLVGVMILVASFIPFIISFILRTHLE